MLTLAAEPGRHIELLIDGEIVARIKVFKRKPDGTLAEAGGKTRVGFDAVEKVKIRRVDDSPAGTIQTKG